MDVLLQVIVNGLSAGGPYAVVAIGLSLVFGVLNIVNFGHGGAYTAGAFAAMVALQMLGLNIVLAFALACGFAYAVGYLIERVAVRPLRDAPLLMPLITTLGIGMVLENIAQFIFGPAPRPFPTPVSLEPIHFGGTVITIWEVVTLGAVVVSVALLQLFLYRSDFGKAVRAVAEDRRMAGLLGIDVDRVIVVTFCIASALGGLAGILGAALYNVIFPMMGSGVILKGFTAAVLGGLEVISGAIIGGLLLGLAEAVSGVYISSAWRDGIALVILVVVLLFKPTGLLGHRQLEKVERPSLTVMPLPPLPKFHVRQPLLWVGLAIALVLPLVVDSYVGRILTLMVMYAVLSLSLNLVAGFAGVMSLAHAAFFGFGAYASALLTLRLSVPVWLAFLVSATLTGLFGLAFAWPVMRLRGHYVAMGTLGLGAIVTIVLSNWMELTRGPMGLPGIPTPVLFGVEVQGPGYYYLMLGMLLFSTIVIIRMIDSAFGRALRAMRDDELGAASVGVNTRFLKMTTFGVAAAIAGACGSFWAHYATYISPDAFTFMDSIAILAMVVLGGLGSIPGAILGAAVLAALPEVLRFASDYRQAVYGALLILVVLFRPQGLLGFQPPRSGTERASAQPKDDESRRQEHESVAPVPGVEA